MSVQNCTSLQFYYIKTIFDDFYLQKFEQRIKYEDSQLEASKLLVRKVSNLCHVTRRNFSTIFYALRAYEIVSC